MKKKNKNLVFTKVEEFLGHDLKKMISLDIGEVIADAINEAAVNNISVNAVIINKKYAKTERIFYDAGCGVYEIPPMICGLYLEFCDLPKEFAFAVTEIPKPEFYNQIDEAKHHAKVAQHRAEVAERALKEAVDNYVGCLCRGVEDAEECRNCNQWGNLKYIETEEAVPCAMNKFLQKAEKKLAEENSGKKEI